jgi:hypothetical protein
MGIGNVASAADQYSRRTISGATRGVKSGELRHVRRSNATHSQVQIAGQCRKWGSQTATCSAPAAAITATIAVSASSVLKARVSSARNAMKAGADVTPLGET